MKRLLLLSILMSSCECHVRWESRPNEPVIDRPRDPPGYSAPPNMNLRAPGFRAPGPLGNWIQ